MRLITSMWAAGFRGIFLWTAFLVAAWQLPVAAQSGFSEAYLNGKTFLTVDLGDDGKPFESFRLSFGAGQVTARAVVPEGEAENLPYAVSGGVLSVDDGSTRISIVSAETDFLYVRLEYDDGHSFSRWYFDEAKAMAYLRTVPFLPGAWIEIDGDFGDWAKVATFVNEIEGEGPKITRYGYATDGEFLYFYYEADRDLGDHNEELYVELNWAVEFGIDRQGNGWFFDGENGHGFEQVGGALAFDDNRIEGKLPLYLLGGTFPEFALFAATFNSDFGEHYADVLLQVDGRLPAGGADLMAILKFRYFEQVGTGAPTVRTEEPFQFELVVDATTPSSVTGARVAGPGGVLQTLTQDGDSRYWDGGVYFEDRASMDAQFPNGDYTFSVDILRQETKTAELSLVGEFPPAPRFLNLTAARDIDSEETFVLSLEGFAGADADDFVLVGIEEIDGDIIYETERLPGNTSSIEIPGRVLQPDREYAVWAMVASVVDKDLEAVEGGEALAAFASETRAILRTNPLAAPAGNWALAGMTLPDRLRPGLAPFDAVFDQWYSVEGPAFAQLDANGVFSGAVNARLEMVSHGQFLVYNDGASVPEEAGTINRSGDVIFVGSDLTDGTIGVRIPESATQADFAGLWHFIGLNAGTVLTKTVKDGVSGETFSVEGHDAPIATDGTQTLLDVQRNETTMQTLSTMMNANGSGGIANLLWRGNGELEFSDFEFPLLTNASRDFAFGIGETEDKQSLMVGVRSPDSADASWLTGQWRFQSIWISKSHRMFENEQTGMQRWFLGNDDALAVAPGERLGWVDLAGRVEGWVETVTLEMAESVGIAPNGVFVSDGVSWHLNRSGDILVAGWEEDWGWAIEIGIKVTDAPVPTRLLTAYTAGYGRVAVSPIHEETDPSFPIETYFIQGESAILRAEPDHGWRFTGWVGDVPEGREQDETLVVTMDRDRWIWATFEEGPVWEPVPWDTETDSDGDGVLDLIEHLLADRSPYAAEAGRNPLEVKRGPEGVSLELAVWELYPWLWALEYSEDLRFWGPVPEELVTRNYETREGRELVRIFVRMPETETAFFRLRISEESQ